jgi:hypothetical protein
MVICDQREKEKFQATGLKFGRNRDCAGIKESDFSSAHKKVAKTDHRSESTGQKNLYSFGGLQTSHQKGEVTFENYKHIDLQSYCKYFFPKGEG